MSSTNSPTDHAELARLAGEATGGDWSIRAGDEGLDGNARVKTRATVMVYADDDCDVHPVADCSCNHSCRMERDQAANAAFIAAANPARVLALLAEIAALRGRENELIAAHAVAVERIGRQRDVAVGLVGQIVGDAFGCNEDSCLVSHRMIGEARTFLASMEPKT